MALDMGRFRVRSNCIAPFAWSRLIGTIPTNTDEEKARVAKIQQMTPEKIAPCDCTMQRRGKEVSGQIFGVRNNEIFRSARIDQSVLLIHKRDGQQTLF